MASQNDKRLKLNIFVDFDRKPIHTMRLDETIIIRTVIEKSLVPWGLATKKSTFLNFGKVVDQDQPLSGLRQDANNEARLRIYDGKGMENKNKQQNGSGLKPEIW